MPALSVFLQGQDPTKAVPPHRCTKTFALLLLATYPRLVHVDLVAGYVQLRTPEAWSAVKARVRPHRAAREVVVIRDSGHPLMLSYPPVPQETAGRKIQSRIWRAATKF